MQHQVYRFVCFFKSVLGVVDMSSSLTSTDLVNNCCLKLTAEKSNELNLNIRCGPTNTSVRKQSSTPYGKYGDVYDRNPVIYLGFFLFFPLKFL